MGRDRVNQRYLPDAAFPARLHICATLTDALQRGNVGSRRERRRTPRTQWVTSHTYKEITHRATLYRERLQQVIARKAAA